MTTGCTILRANLQLLHEASQRPSLQLGRKCNSCLVMIVTQLQAWVGYLVGYRRFVGIGSITNKQLMNFFFRCAYGYASGASFNHIHYSTYPSGLRAQHGPSLHVDYPSSIHWKNRPGCNMWWVPIAEVRFILLLYLLACE